MQALLDSVESLSPKERKALATLLKRQGVNLYGLTPIFKRASAEPLLLSYAQQRQWFLWQLAPDSSAYNICAALRLEGALDVDALRASCAALVERHEVLRTTFLQEDDRTVQVVHPAGEFNLYVDSLSDGDTERQITDYVQAQTSSPFDLQQGPLLRMKLLQVAEQDHVLVLTVHHIVADGWSMPILVNDLVQLYVGYTQGQAAALPALPIQYGDYALWQRNWMDAGERERQLAYWLEKLGGEQPVLELPADRVRPTVPSGVGARVAIDVDAALLASLKGLAQQQGVTLFMVLLASFQALLHRYSGQRQVRVGVPIANRARSETESLIGFFVNTQVLQAEFTAQMRFSDLLEQVRQTALDAQSHQDLPFEQLVEALQPERSMSHTPMFQVMFNHQTQAASAGRQLPGLSVNTLDWQSHTTQFDLTLDTAEHTAGLSASLTYAVDLFDAGSIEQLGRHWHNLLLAIIAQPQQRVDELPLLGADERQRIIHDWNRTTADYPQGQCVPQLFEAQAERSPEACALVFAGQSLSYRELNRQANQLAHKLRDLGVGPEALVGVALERGPQMIIGLLAILKAGGAYVPLDPDYPSERLAHMMNDSGLQLLLTQGRLLENLPIPATVQSLCLDQASGWLDDCSEQNPVAQVLPGNLAYVIYTSGSTGLPKGVTIRHDALVNFLWTMGERPGITASDRVLSLTSLSFDIAGLELYLPLLRGAAVVLLRDQENKDPHALLKVIDEQAASVIQATPSTWRMVLDAAPEGALKGKKILCGGEALTAELAQRLIAQAGHVWNLYGPTETTIWSGVHYVGPHAGTWLGRPIANTAFHILDDNFDAVPVGVSGELYIGGDGLARGYLRRPGLTAERFVPDPFGNGRLYRTGDLVRYRQDGVVEYIGRLDHQLKIRGFRIELGEIEACLVAHEQVREAVVIDIDGPLGKQLAAYLVSVDAAAHQADDDAQSAWRQALKNHMKQQLPDYMVPTHLVVVDKLPLTPNGKVDRKALPRPDATAQQGVHVAPQTPLQVALAHIWAEVLKVDQVGLTDNFFELGGHSLLATQMIGRIRQRLDLEVPLRRLFEAQDLQGFAELAAQASGAAVQAMPVVERGQPLAVSYAQQRQWILWQLEPASAAYNISAALRLTGHLDPQALRQAFEALISRHETLRTTFRQDGDTPLQIIHPATAFVLDQEALDSEAQLTARVQHLVQLPFDLVQGPLLRVKLLRLDADEHVLVLTLHHIVTDGWSTSILVDELVQRYAGFSQGQAVELAPLPIQYADYAAWQRQWLQAGERDRQLAYWTQKLGGEQPVLELPTDRARPALPSRAGAQVTINLEPAMINDLKALAKHEGVTLFMLLLASFQTLLQRYSAQSQVRVGVPVANRTRGEIERLIGFFVNTQVLQAEFDTHATFSDVLQQVKHTALEAQAHQDLPFEQLVDALQPQRSLNHSPLFQVMFNHQTDVKGPRLSLPGLTVEGLNWQAHSTQFDLALDTVEHHSGLSAAFTYATQLFDASTIEQMGRHWRNLLQAIIEQPAQRVDELRLLDDAERRKILRTWNRTDAIYPGERYVHQRFEHQVRQQPHAPALLFADQTLSYEQLNRRANRLAHKLRELGVGPEVLVGVALERSLEMVVGLLAILKAGGAYVPLDPDYPTDRLAYMLEDSGVKLLLTQSHLLAQLPIAESMHSLCLDQDGGWLESYSDSNPSPALSSNNLAYVIYTSGSTGRPKGAGNTHEALLNRLDWMQKAYGLQADDTVLQKTPFSFDVSVWEFFWPLMAGARLAIAQPGDHRDPERLRDTIQRYQVSTLHFVPSMLQVFMSSEGVEQCQSLRRVVCSGEALSKALSDQTRARLPAAGLYNLYGPTEAAIDVTHWTCGEEHGVSVPIGLPIDNLKTHILEPSLTPAARGVSGELYLGGIGLARGYHQRPALTAERFVPDPFDPVGGGRLYRTGDLARYREHGVIDYVGRIDHQVKIRGLRIELGEIEARLVEHPQVREAVVLAVDGALGKQLVGYCVTADGTVPAPGSEEGARLRSELAQFLGRELPDYMVPAHWLLLAQMPVTANGKLARNLLPAPDMSQALEEYRAPRTEVEQQLVTIWQDVLNLPRVGVIDNFFALGGDSIISIQVVSQARQLGLQLAPKDLFLQQTIEKLAGIVTQVQAPADVQPVALHGLNERQVQALPIPHGQVEALYSLSPMQQGMLFLGLNSDPEDELYINQLNVSVEGLQVARLRQAWESVAQRHDVLRTGFLWQNLDEPVQFVLRDIGLPLTELDWRHEPATDVLVKDLAREERLRGFNLAQPPLQRVVLIRLGDDRYQLIWTYHHILLDGWSTSQLMGEILAAYSGQTLAPVVPYRNYIGWLRQQDPSISQAFWGKQLAEFEEPTYLADAFASGKREQGHQALYSRFTPQVTQDLKAFAAAQRITLNTLVQGAWLLLLSRYSGQRTVCFGATVAGRPSALPGAQSMLGLFINTLPVIHEVDPQASVGQWLQDLQRVNLELRDHEYTPLGDIQRWAGRSGQALFDSIIVFENQPLDRTLREWKDDSLRFGDVGGAGLTDFPMDLMVTLEDYLAIEYMYLRQCFSDAAVEGIRANMEALMLALAADARQPVGNLGLKYTPPAPQLALPASAPAPLVHERIQHWAERQGSATAVKVGERSLSFAQLETRANQLAHHLIAEGVGPEVRVGVALPRSETMIVALLAVLKAGAAYVPIDAAYPRERLSYLMQDSGIALLLTDSRIVASLPINPALHVLEVDRLETCQWPASAPQNRVHPENLAYVIYTSGSTGQPKGVVVSHGPLAMHCQAVGERYEMSPADCELLFMSFAFDGAHERWLTTLTHGGCLLLRDDELWTPEQTYSAMHQHGVTVAAFPPVYLLQLAEHARLDGNPPPVRIYCFGGDAVPEASYALAREALKPQYIINGYGPTETVVTPLIWKAAEGQPCGAIYAPIGECVGQRSAYVMDIDLNPLPPGVAGELYLGGEGVARGYLNRAGLTAERFVADPCARGGRLYRTGDLVRQRENGTFDYLGRLDNQVKIRGFRIELGEIEACLTAMDEVGHAAVVVREGPSGNQLFGYVTLSDFAPQGVLDSLRERLKQALPDYMVPAQLMVLDRLPLNPNGKLDRNALPMPDARSEYLAPRNELEQAMAAIWQTVLKVERVGVTDNFFELGGDSILSMQVVAKSRALKKFGFTLRLRDLIQKPSIAQLTAAPGKNVPLLALNAEVSGTTPLFCVHAGFGTVFDYEPLARRLNGTCAVIGIQARQLLDPNWEEQSLVAMAKDYVGYLRDKQPQGPYRLLGWSLGATLSLLMAAELERQGQGVEFLALLDSFVPSPANVQQSDHWLDDLSELLRATVPGAAAVDVSDTREENPQTVRALIVQALGQVPAGLGVDELTQVFACARTLKRLSRALDYCPKVAVQPLSWWVAGRDDEQHELARQIGSAGWVAQPLTCGHFQVPREPSVLRELEDALNELLAVTEPS
ncbi:amino acid adenylation domain-containing protein [Pseudomonas nabeulensis]|uniref:Amino acid adenylation domain-containing protein n=1 Tax=Pseudomonas nabeulensis TaxID=2293833 RepID=A0A4Z0B443_9PSED|nr:non-ribosomal peptide synthetase [Pseudomonas nabeulensis]TFY93785.1 amino acid adenylation domain-containing protein [Pseudomonas nabeulensis]